MGLNLKSLIRYKKMNVYNIIHFTSPFGIGKIFCPEYGLGDIKFTVVVDNHGDPDILCSDSLESAKEGLEGILLNRMRNMNHCIEYANGEEDVHLDAT